LRLSDYLAAQAERITALTIEQDRKIKPVLGAHPCGFHKASPTTDSDGSSSAAGKAKPDNGLRV